MEREPKTLQQTIAYFSDPDNCLNFLVARRFPDGVLCPRCGSKEVRFLATRRIWECTAGAGYYFQAQQSDEPNQRQLQLQRH